MSSGCPEFPVPIGIISCLGLRVALAVYMERTYGNRGTNRQAKGWSRAMPISYKLPAARAVR